MKSCIQLDNPTCYPSPLVTRSVITVKNSNCYNFRKQKIEGYETRLYYEYKDTIDSGGFAIYVTLTYNDKSIPKFYGFNCLDTSHIRYLFHDTRFFKDIKTKYRYSFKYFVGAEFGEGGKAHNYKGKRGIGNNPHYHLIIFFRPLPYEDCLFWDTETGEQVYLKPDLHPYTVRKNIEHYWQGENTRRRDYTYGLCDFGKVDINGEIKDYKAISYASKYCVKDKYFYQVERALENCLVRELLAKYSDIDNSFEKTSLINDEVTNIIKEFRKKHSYRVMCSHGLGISALKEVDNYFDPKIVMPTKKGDVARSPCLYLYRKLYTTVNKTPEGLVYYKLTDLGVNYKLHRFRKDISKSVQQTYDRVKSLYDNKFLLLNYLYSDDRHSSFPFLSPDTDIYTFDLSKLNFRSFSDLIFNNSLDKPDNIFYRYAIFKKVYENRCYRHTPFGDCPTLDVISDYLTSLEDTHKFGNHYANTHRIVSQSDIFPFCYHSYFMRYTSLFAWFDDVNNYFFMQKDREDKAVFEHWKKLRYIQNRMNTKYC